MEAPKNRETKRPYPWRARTVEQPTTKLDLEQNERIAPLGFRSQEPCGYFLRAYRVPPDGHAPLCQPSCRMNEVNHV